jgi:hypothetical protein
MTENGMINISSDVFTNIAGAAATNCYGVKGMALRSATDGLVHLLRRESMAKGVKVRADEEGAALLGIEKTIGDGFAGLECDQGSGLPVGDVALVGAVAVEEGI